MKKNLETAEIKYKDVAEKIKAIIGPHAGFRYSGPVAAWSYKYLEPLKVNEKLRVFLLGPSHYKFLRGISISSCTELETPVGNLPVDTQSIRFLT
jgi:MEMO1 family protein